MTTCWGAAPPAAYWADSTATCSSSVPSLGPLSGGSPGNKRRRYCNFNEKQVQVSFPPPGQSYSIVAALLLFNIQNCTALALSLAQQKTLSIRDNRQTKHTPAIREWNGSRWALFDKKAESERHFIHPFFSNTYLLLCCKPTVIISSSSIINIIPCCVLFTLHFFSNSSTTSSSLQVILSTNGKTFIIIFYLPMCCFVLVDGRREAEAEEWIHKGNKVHTLFVV